MEYELNEMVDAAGHDAEGSAWVVSESDGAYRDLSERLVAYSLQVIRLFCSLPSRPETQVVGKQFLRSGTAPGAHYREARRARSVAEFVSKLEGALQELDETDYWLELVTRGGMLTGDETETRLRSLVAETRELTAIIAASVKTAKQRRDERRTP